MQEINRLIGQRIKEVREEKGITQKQLGEFLNYSPMGISYFEQGIREMKISDINKVATFFGKETSHFLSAGITMFRVEKSSNDQNVAKSVDAFDKFILKRSQGSEK